MTATEIKVCGIRNPDDVGVLSDLGVNALGLVFYEKSPRFVNIPQAQKIALKCSPFLNLVALFVNHSAAFIQQVLSELPINTLQFHGNELPEFCAQFNRPYIKAIRVSKAQCISQGFATYHSARAILFDAYDKNNSDMYGGTGTCFEWNLLSNQKNRPMPVVLSGGLDSANVEAALRQVRPDAVDVSSGVESTLGVKSIALVTQFVDAVRKWA